jgi:hypothetical protein
MSKKYKENIELTLTKTKDYDLKPYGRFSFKWCPSDAINRRVNIISVGELEYLEDKGMPMSDSQITTMSDYMKNKKTEILVDKLGDWYTITPRGLCRVTHHKLERYKEFLKQRDYGDSNSKEAWDDYKN